ncbi:WD domain protein [Fusarium tjaetaba]|uniref:WD domain protein n=1 Tax=Fusarium tjaetaba TaxID=1567544 RepID=A0A8H5RYX5_9HYPO|nr:WD domain protein [Fusarium tjaetaba]KAF5642268.1 WD domain protein [Fusarium tjaetaba]
MEHIWAKAYKMIQDDDDHSQLLDKFEAYVQKAGDNDREDISRTSHGVERLKEIQKLAEKKLEELPENRTSFVIGGKRIVVRESVQKAIRTITQFKALISGAVSAEPHAALAWACILGVLPILESIFQQDEAAADGLGKIVFLLVRYQAIQDTVLPRHFEDRMQTESTQQLAASIESKLFVLQYGRSKWRRNLGGIFRPEDWKQKWNEIDSARQLVDQGIQDRVTAKTLDTWEQLNKIQLDSTEVLEAVRDIETRAREIQNEQRSIKERDLLLSLPVASKAIFDSTDVLGVENPCLEGTQRAILTEIHEWAEEPTAAMIFWLHGLAGTGKSTVALTVANALKRRMPFTSGIDAPERAFLGASFFFKQSDASRNSIQAFVPTVAICLAEVFPDFKSLVAKAIEKNSAIGTKTPQQQLETLIAKPFSVLDERSLVPLRLIIVIDALDECAIPGEATSLITILAEQLKNLHHIQLRFLITSRAEKHILGSFEQLPQNLHRSVVLEKIKEFDEGDDNRDDIMFYLAYSLAKLTKKHAVPEGCITESTIKELRNKADGLFIYAATACRFLDAEDFDDDEARQERLNLILESTADSDEFGDKDSDIDDWEADSPQNKIDEIYRKVLSFPDRERMSPRIRQKTYNSLCTLIGFLVVLFKPPTIPTLKKFLPSLADSLDRLLRKLHAIVSVPPNESTRLELVHQSFRDFVLSRKRSKQLKFGVQERKMHKEALLRCLDLMSSELHEDICELRWPGIDHSEISQERVRDKIQEHLRYACRYWVDHLSKLNDEDRSSVGVMDGGNLHKFLESHFLHWLEAMILIKETASAIPMLNKLQLLVRPSECPDLSSSISYFKQFILGNRYVIDEWPLQIYVFATTFSLKDSKARSLFEAHTPRWISQLPKVEGQWTSQLCGLYGHTEKIICAAFSPAYDLVLTVSLDRTARLWDSVTGTQRSIFEKADSDAYTCGDFSSDGKFIGLGTRSGRVEVKDFVDERSFYLGGHKKDIETLTFSPKSRKLFASTSKDGDLGIWDVDERCAKRVLRIREPYGSEEPPTSEDPDPMKLLCQFTADGRFLIVAGTSISMTMWSVESGECIKVFGGADTTFVMDINVFPDGNSATILQTPLIRRPGSGDETINKSITENIDDLDEVVKFRHINNDMGSRTVTIINLATEEVEYYSDENEKVRWISTTTQNANHILVGSDDTIELVDLKALSKVVLFEIPDFESLVCISRLKQEACEIYDSHGCRLPLPIDLSVASICFSHDGKYCALGLRNRTCQLWNKSMAAQLFPDKQWQKIIFPPDGTCIALVSTRGEIEVFDGTTLDLIMECEKTSEFDVGDIKLSPDGQTIGISYTDFVAGNASIELWSVTATEPIWRQSSPRCIDCFSFEFSPDNTVFALCWGGRQLDDPGSWVILDLSTFKQTISENTPLLVFHPKGHLFAMLRFTEEAEGYVDVRETASKSLVRIIECDVRGTVWMSFTPSGGLVLSDNEDDDSESTVLMLDIEKGSKIGSYTIGGRIEAFWISEDGCLNCSNGRLPLPSSHRDREDKDPSATRQDEQSLLFLGQDWIYRGLKKIMRLPPAFASSKSVLNGNTLATAYKDRELRLIKFDLEKMPVC